ncbi:DUF309 domain-containing protein [Paenibacillus sp. HN-1]|nr:DUF309 domain-containing protein [Paenibacillus sp. CGMCC 1.18879]MBY9084820.1 DUF309 domain-containing protein [Paenibacillus sinensis]
MAYDPLYVAYLVYFNRDRDYFECHEVLEKLWLATERNPLYKGLLQVAVGLYHFRDGNIRGARLMLESAEARLRDYPAETLGIRLDALLQEVRGYIRRLNSFDVKPFEYRDLTIPIVDENLRAAVAAAGEALKPSLPQRRGPQRTPSVPVERR